MIICDHEFDFSTLDAADVERMQAATEKHKARARTEGSHYSAEGDGYSDWLRFQCRSFMAFLDEVLGAGASELLGLDGSNFNKCIQVSMAFKKAMADEKTEMAEMLNSDEEKSEKQEMPAYYPAPMNRAQRRAAEKAGFVPTPSGLTLATTPTQTLQPAPPTVPDYHFGRFPDSWVQDIPGIRINRPDSPSREIHGVEDVKAAQDAVVALKDDPEAMKQLTAAAMKIAAERHV